ncbi:MAG: N-acetylmuramoyl-L-alanine amidase [Culicoidibacterales bacterium]
MKKFFKLFSLNILIISNLILISNQSFNIQLKSNIQAMENNLNLNREITKGVVIHNDAGSISGSQYQYLKSYSTNQLARGFAHYYVAKNDVFQFWDDSKVAWHTGNFSGNTEYIGVEVTNSYGAESKFLENEQETFKLVAKLLMKYHLPANRETVRLHKEFTPTACPHRSWALHGNSIENVKDYFIGEIKKYMFEINAGETVQLVSTAKLAIDNSAINEEDRRLIGIVVGRSVMMHAGNGNYYPSYTIKWPDGRVKNYVDFDVQNSSENNYKFIINQDVCLTEKSGLAIDNSPITAQDKQLRGKIINRAMMRHKGNGIYYPSYTVKWTSGKIQNYVYFDLIALKDDEINKSQTPNIQYASHVQNIGWQNSVKNGELSGTSGKALRLEAIKLFFNNANENGDISYATHVQNIGWQNGVKNGELSGTSGRSLRLEAINIKLTGNMSQKYDIYYRVHIQNYGWLNWAKNGENAGSAGKSLRMEAIEVKLVKKQERIALSEGRAYVS